MYVQDALWTGHTFNKVCCELFPPKQREVEIFRWYVFVVYFSMGVQGVYLSAKVFFKDKRKVGRFMWSGVL